MNFGPLLFLGIFLCFVSAWIGLVFVPTATLSHVKATVAEGATSANPQPYTGIQAIGRKIYQREGCVYCHTQQVRGGQYNNDLERGWGARRSHPQDYIYDYPVLLGTMRTGPDLVNIGARQNNDNWHHAHLYDPQLLTPGSLMAPYRFLYRLEEIGSVPSPAAVQFNYVYVTLAGDHNQVLSDLKDAGFGYIEPRGGRYIGAFDPAKTAYLEQINGVTKAEPYVPQGYQIVATDEALALVAYLKSLDRNYDLPPVENYGRLK